VQYTLPCANNFTSKFNWLDTDSWLFCALILKKIKQTKIEWPKWHMTRSCLFCTYCVADEWLGSRVVGVLNSGAEGPGFAVATVSGNSLRHTVHTYWASVHQAAKLVAAFLRVAGVTAGLMESNGSLPPGLRLTSPAGWLPRTGIGSGTLRSVIEYGLPLPFLCDRCNLWPLWMWPLGLWLWLFEKSL